MKTMIIIGAKGDLGSQLADLSERAGLETKRAGREFAANESNYDSNTYIHLCIPAASLADYEWLKNTQAYVVLHDSVMNTSELANLRYFDGSATSVHMLMNSHKTVVINDDASESDDISALFTDLGQNAVSMPVEEHDLVMASTQAPLALLCEVIHTPLKQYKERGLLTPSGEELERALDARVSTWTPATITSLLQNPQLYGLVSDMNDVLDANKV